MAPDSKLASAMKRVVGVAGDGVQDVPISITEVASRLEDAGKRRHRARPRRRASAVRWKMCGPMSSEAPPAPSSLRRRQAELPTNLSGRRHRPERGRGGHLGRAEIAPLDQPLRDPDRSIEAGVLADDQRQAALPGDLDHLAGSPDGDRERLLRPSRERRPLETHERLGVMQRDLGGDIDGIDHAGVEHRRGHR